MNSRPYYVSYSFSLSLSPYKMRFLIADNISQLKAVKQRNGEKLNSKPVSVLLREMLKLNNFNNILSLNKNYH